MELLPREVLEVRREKLAVEPVLDELVNRADGLLEAALEAPLLVHIEVGGEGAFDGLAQAGHEAHIRQGVAAMRLHASS